MSAVFVLEPLEVKPDFAEGARRAESVLKYLDTLARIAAGRNDRATVMHFSECWQTVAEAFFGRYSVPRVPLYHQPYTRIAELPAPLTKPAWFIQKYSRPLRKVLERRLRRGVIVYVLDCGHELEDITATLESPPPKRRRCKQCKSAIKGS